MYDDAFRIYVLDNIKSIKDMGIYCKSVFSNLKLAVLEIKLLFENIFKTLDKSW